MAAFVWAGSASPEAQGTLCTTHCTGVLVNPIARLPLPPPSKVSTGGCHVRRSS
ncbi:MAG: hypothetical protein ACI841_002700 [Planctomycetota bacterium]|jgi:hypothetical protein